jgi:glycosyltransferase involved in cell wall biosynthesis
LLPGWRRDVAELLAAADVFVLASLWEGLPRALVEAMKSGVAPVCYATDGVKDLIRDGENGFLVAQRDAKALAQRILDLLKDEALRKRICAAAAASIGPEFDIDGMVRQQEALYSDLLEN